MAGRNFQSDLYRRKIPFPNAANGDDNNDGDDENREFSIKIRSYSHGLQALNGVINEMKKNYKIVQSGGLRARIKSREADSTDIQPTFMWIDLNNDKMVPVNKNNNCDNDIDDCNVHCDNFGNYNSSDVDNDDIGENFTNRNENRNNTYKGRKLEIGTTEWCESPTSSPSSSTTSTPPLFPSSPSHPIDVFTSFDRALDDLYILSDPGTIILVLTQADIQPLVQLLSEKQRFEY